jgi:hypothetical protein
MPKRSLSEIREARKIERIHANEKMRKWRARNPQKVKARSAVFVALRAGKLIRQPCEVCGAPKSEAHHPSYEKPLYVRWFCKKHHENEHARIDALTNL